jgi:hypothetical protein
LREISNIIDNNEILKKDNPSEHIIELNDWRLIGNDVGMPGRALMKIYQLRLFHILEIKPERVSGELLE